MERINCITFDKAAQDALPEHIKEKMKADREMARMRKDGYKCNLGVGEFFNPCMNREITCLQCHYFIKR